MKDIIGSFILIGIEALACDLFFQTFMRERYQEKRWVHGGVDFLLGVLWLVNAFHAKEFGVKVVSSILIMSVCMVVLYKARISQIFFCAICYEGILLGMDMGLLAIIQYFIDGTLTDILQKGGKIVLLWILFKLVLFLFIVEINRKFSQRAYQLLRDDEWIRFLFFPIFTVIAIILMLIDESIERKTMCIISFGLLMANVMLFYLIRDFVGRAEKSKKDSLVEEQRMGQIELYESMELSYNQQKKKVHEFKNHLNCIQGLLQEDKPKEALNYVGKINNLAEQHMNYFTTLNPVADVVINQKHQQALEEEISMVTVLDNLSGIPMEDKDMVVLLSNLLNNAIEACRKLEKKERQIKFKFVQNEQHVILSIKNPIKEKLKIMEDKIVTTKENKREHGVGLYNIEKVIVKYGGEGFCKSEGGEFSYTIIFQKEEMYRIYKNAR